MSSQFFKLSFFATMKIMERANHINIAMADINGSARSKATADAARSGQPLGSTVSFHNIRYKVQLRSGICSKENSSGKEILTDLKLVQCFYLIKSLDCCEIMGPFFLHFLMVLNASDISRGKKRGKTNNFTQVSAAIPASGLIR